MFKKMLGLMLCLICLPLMSFAQESIAIDSTSIASLRNFISNTGKVVPNVESNSVLVVDYPNNISMIEDYLKAADVPGKQVIIEAKVVEVKLENEHSMGVNWSAFSDGVSMGGLDLHHGLDSLGNRQIGLAQNIPHRPVSWEPLNGDEQSPFTFGIFNDHIDLVVQALATKLDTNILSAPKITTINNRRAKIDIVKTIPYLESVTLEERETAYGLVLRYVYNYNYADEGVSLEVVPFINPDQSVTMTLFPQVKEIVRWHSVAGPSGASQNPNLPETDVRMTQTKVKVHEGQTLIIGGLIREKETAGETKVPLLGDIPFLGALFRNKIKSKEKTELIIMVSPMIVTPELVAQMGNVFSANPQKEVKAKESKLDAIEKNDPDKWKTLISRVDQLQDKMDDVVSERKDLEEEIAATETN